MRVTCEHCHGSGYVVVEAVEEEFECPELVVGHERIHCYATVPHPGEPHMAILCEPCPDCGGYDECWQFCATYDMEPRRDPLNKWYRWNDGDVALTREPDRVVAAEWRRRFQPNGWFAA